MSIRQVVRLVATPTATLLLLAACGGERTPSPNSSSASPPSSAPPSNTTSVAPTGKVITIEMVTDETGNYFKPKTVDASRGDVLKFVLTSGVHNVHFLADSNAGVPNLPAPTGFAQLPGQAFDVMVTMEAGRSYYFQCDPHALLGMIGHVNVVN